MPGAKDDELRSLIASRGNRVIRQRDAKSIYARPNDEFARLAESETLARIAPGYWVLVPELERGRWKPDIAALALGIGIADYGRDAVALMGISAGRRHGAWPRAAAVAQIAVPRQRPTLQTANGTIRFVKRNVPRLDVEAVRTDVATGWITTLEQSLIDLTLRPELAGDPSAAREILTQLAQRADLGHLYTLNQEAAPSVKVPGLPEVWANRDKLVAHLLSEQARRAARAADDRHT